jgi:uncharacterized protein YndB with AHSA1/START domain
MAKAGYAEFTDPRTVSISRLLAAPPARVWEFLTRADKLAGWFADGDIGERVGAAVFLDQDTDRVPFRMKHAIRGEVLAVEHERLLQYTWLVEHEGKLLDSVVTFALAPEEGGAKTRLAITHRPVREGFFALTATGWHSHLDTLESRLAGKTPKPITERFAAVLPKYRELAKPFEDRPAFNPVAGEQMAAKRSS